MNEVKQPVSRRLLDIAIERLTSRFGEAQRIRRAVANTIVAQMMPECVIKGGSSLKFRYGDIATRVTKDMDAAHVLPTVDEAVAWANELIEKIDNA